MPARLVSKFKQVAVFFLISMLAVRLGQHQSGSVEA
jgi:hypothetical protein